MLESPFYIINKLNYKYMKLYITLGLTLFIKYIKMYIKYIQNSGKLPKTQIKLVKWTHFKINLKSFLSYNPLCKALDSDAF